MVPVSDSLETGVTLSHQFLAGYCTITGFHDKLFGTGAEYVGWSSKMRKSRKRDTS